MNPNAISRRSFLATGSMATTAAIIAGTTFPQRMAAQTPASEIPTKTLNGNIILTIPGEPMTFNLDLIPDDNVWPVTCNIFNTLFSLDNNYNVIPELATGYEVSDDGLAITVPLNPLATWHDGTPLTAKDVKYTLEQIVNTPESSSASLISAIESVDVIDDHTAQINLKQPSASVIGFLSWYGVFILPAHIYEGSDWADNYANFNPIGSGPFKFVSYDAGSSVRLVANEQYFGEGPYLESLTYQIMPDSNTAVQALQNGEINGTGIPNAQVANLEANPDLKVIGKVFPSPLYFGFNMTKAPFDNVDVRRAVGMAIDRDQIVATALGGYGTAENHYYPSVIEWASNPDATCPPYDVEGAKALLDSAGFPMNGKSRFSAKLLLFTGWPEMADTSTVVKEQLGAIGIDVELVLLEWAAYETEITAGNFDLGIIGGFQGPDPSNMRLRYGSDVGGMNYWGFHNEEFEKLLAEGDALGTIEDRQPIYFKAQEILAEEVPTVILALMTFYDALTSKLTGIWNDPDDPASSQVGMNRYNLAKLEG